LSCLAHLAFIGSLPRKLSDGSVTRFEDPNWQFVLQCSTGIQTSSNAAVLEDKETIIPLMRQLCDVWEPSLPTLQTLLEKAGAKCTCDSISVFTPRESQTHESCNSVIKLLLSACKSTSAMVMKKFAGRLLKTELRELGGFTESSTGGMQRLRHYLNTALCFADVFGDEWMYTQICKGCSSFFPDSQASSSFFVLEVLLHRAQHLSHDKSVAFIFSHCGSTILNQVSDLQTCRRSLSDEGTSLQVRDQLRVASINSERLLCGHLKTFGSMVASNKDLVEPLLQWECGQLIRGALGSPSIIEAVAELLLAVVKTFERQENISLDSDQDYALDSDLLVLENGAAKALNQKKVLSELFSFCEKASANDRQARCSENVCLKMVELLIGILSIQVRQGVVALPDVVHRLAICCNSQSSLGRLMDLKLWERFVDSRLELTELAECSVRDVLLYHILSWEFAVAYESDEIFELMRSLIRALKDLKKLACLAFDESVPSNVDDCFKAKKALFALNIVAKIAISEKRKAKPSNTGRIVLCSLDSIRNGMRSAQGAVRVNKASQATLYTFFVCQVYSGLFALFPANFATQNRNLLADNIHEIMRTAAQCNEQRQSAHDPDCFSTAIPLILRGLSCLPMVQPQILEVIQSTIHDCISSGRLACLLRGIYRTNRTFEQLQSDEQYVVKVDELKTRLGEGFNLLPIWQFVISFLCSTIKKHMPNDHVSIQSLELGALLCNPPYRTKDLNRKIWEVRDQLGPLLGCAIEYLWKLSFVNMQSSLTLLRWGRKARLALYRFFENYLTTYGSSGWCDVCSGTSSLNRVECYCVAPCIKAVVDEGTDELVEVFCGKLSMDRQKLHEKFKMVQRVPGDFLGWFTWKQSAEQAYGLVKSSLGTVNVRLDAVNQSFRPGATERPHSRWADLAANNNSILPWRVERTEAADDDVLEPCRAFVQLLTLIATSKQHNSSAVIIVLNRALFTMTELIREGEAWLRTRRTIGTSNNQQPSWMHRGDFAESDLKVLIGRMRAFVLSLRSYRPDASARPSK